MNDTASDVLSSVLNTSVINVPTHLQRTDDFRSTAPEAHEVEGAETEYYIHVDWSRLLPYEGVPNVKGARKSSIWKYGWRVQKRLLFLQNSSGSVPTATSLVLIARISITSPMARIAPPTTS